MPFAYQGLRELPKLLNSVVTRSTEENTPWTLGAFPSVASAVR